MRTPAIVFVGWLGSALLAASLLLPAGDPPWNSFWREWTAAIAVLLIVVSAVSQIRADRGEVRFDWVSLPTAAFALAVVPWIQWAAGLEFYHGDAVLISAYLAGFGLCLAVSQSMGPEARQQLGDRLAYAMLFAALCSVPMAVLQWVGLLRLDLGIRVAAGRPVAHMEQTNLLCSLLIQGLFGAWRLKERNRLGGRWLCLFAVALLLTVDLTQSRVAWLVMAITTGALWWRRRTLDMSAPVLPGWTLALVIVAGGAIVMPWLDARWGLAGLSLADRLTGGRRPDAWLLFLDAVRHRPWFGWGALQNGHAQFSLALAHPPLLWFFSSAHDVVLDLMVWFGMPLGLLAGGTLIAAVFTRLRRASQPAAFVTALSAMALLIHGLVELPLEYTYFLFPLALMLGVSHSQEGEPVRSVRLPLSGPSSLALLSIAPAILLAMVAREYIPLSVVRPFMDYDKAADHMILGATGDAPDVVLLDQLRAFHIFAAQPAVAGLSPQVIESLRQPLERFPFAPSQEHYAHILALNGHPAEALDALQRSCTFMTPPQCAENRRAWQAWRALGQPLPIWP